VTDPVHWHVGILVKDLDAAIARFTKVLGTTFASPTTMELPGFQDTYGSTTALRVAFSIDGPPYLELMEQAGTGMFSPDQPEGLHHVGIWAEEIDQELAALERDGMRIAARGFVDGHLAGFFCRPEDMCGVKFEWLPDSRRQSILDTGRDNQQLV
jgi:catechol 2,3-dioxygenase-like lactoylglutathione lyase family enzyme